MVRQKQWFFLATLAFLLSFVMPIQVAAQTKQTKVRYIPPSNVSTPKKSVGGITRSSQCADVSCLIAIAPNAFNPDADRYLLTTMERPTFYFNLPQTQGRAYFKLYQEGKGSDTRVRIYNTAFDIDTDSGVIGFKLPEDAPALMVDQGYRWEFTISSNETATETVNGYVKKVSLSSDFVKQLHASPLLERVAMYAKAGIWLDTLSTLAKLRLAQPQDRDLAQEWQELLESVQLAKISQQPLIR